MYYSSTTNVQACTSCATKTSPRTYTKTYCKALHKTGHNDSVIVTYVRSLKSKYMSHIHRSTYVQHRTQLQLVITHTMSPHTDRRRTRKLRIVRYVCIRVRMYCTYAHIVHALETKRRCCICEQLTVKMSTNTYIETSTECARNLCKDKKSRQTKIPAQRRIRELA